ncbi:hypothetical protein NX786_29030 [Telluria mixta]|uniref:FimV N-terminal domain-containing protein n=1 Tax=Telluria mixta TaxID=34071 RepID=A0ABT2C7S4_9BURK|nr:hypothetical protein [Telluria mixta]MCS0633390.1 hypothetical protein [Telluria mixta]WEM96341.1 hypothetical protein P0M04_00910 [Telluria mixta]
MARRTRLLFSSLALAAFASVHAAELGDPRVSSHIGQPLVADVELTMLDDAATPVQVRVASPEVYNGAGIAAPPVLSSLNLSVMRRDGRQFLHVTSLRPVDADHVHLYLELVDRGQRTVRLATLWLTPDPNPAPPPVRAVAPTPAPVADAALLAQVERARTARAAPVPRPEAAKPVPPPPRPVVKRPKPVPVATPEAPPPACARPAGEVQACAALGAKNDELRARLGQVEDRMKKLQVALVAPVAAHEVAKPEARPEAKPETPKEAVAKAEPPKEEPPKEADKPAAPPPPKPVGPRPIHSIKPLVPHKPKAPPPDEGLPWGWIGAAIGVLVLGGAGAYAVVRRRKAPPAASETPGLFEALKARFAARTKAPKAKDGAAEPTLE